MGKLLDAMRAERPNNTVETRLKKELSEEDYADFLFAIKDPTISGHAICRALNANGFKVGISTISSMRRKLNENL